MSSAIREFVMGHALFSHHDHHVSLDEFEKGREGYDFKGLLGYAGADLCTAAGARPSGRPDDDAGVASLWPRIKTTGYGRAVTLGCRELFDLEYEPANFAAITDALRGAIEGKTAAQAYDYFVREKADNRWLVQDGLFRTGKDSAFKEGAFPDYYRFAWRMDDLFAIVDAGPVGALERSSGVEVLSLDGLVKAMNATIDKFVATGKLASFKVGIAYQRDLVVGDPTRHEAERAFTRIRNRKTFHDGIQQNAGAVSALEARPLADYMLHKLLERAHDEDVPVQVHTGYLTGNWGSLAGTKALSLIPLFEKYRRVRFDIFHASWPWGSELGAIAKMYPNVYPDMCWAWAMNPAESERVLAEWLDGVPVNKIFGYGADTGLPWMNVGYSIQARTGIARVLEQKIDAGYFSEATAREAASAVMLRNGEEFYRLA